MNRPVLWLVVPCYNEREVLPVSSKLFLEQLLVLRDAGEISDASRILFVDDGSTDATWQIICDLHDDDPHFEGLKLSRNRGHQNALLAGLIEAEPSCDATISLDADGQDDVTKIADMLAAYKQGYDVVYGVRSSRATDTVFKRFTAEAFYRIVNALGGHVVFNHADYRLMSDRAVRGLMQFGEVNLFLRGLVPLVGFKSTQVAYEREERMAGKSHYPLGKMLHLAFDGISSLSIRPMHIITALGITFSIAGFIGVIWAVLTALFGDYVSGWPSTICVICFFGGLQLLALGLIGEYAGKIYLEVKHRPRYIVDTRTWKDPDARD